MADRYWASVVGGLWNSTANWSASPTLVPTGASVPTSADNVFFTIPATYSVTVTSQSCFDLNVSAGTVTFTGTASAFSVYNNINLTVPISMTVVTLSLNGATGGSPTLRTILSSGTTFECPITVDSGGNGTSVTWKLLDNFTAGTGRLFTLTNGKWDINGFTFSTGQFSSNSATNLRAINYGAAFNLTGSGTVWQTSTALTTGTFTPTGTPLVTVLNATALATTISTGPLSEANAISFKLQGGTYVVSFVSGSTFKNFELAGPAMTSVVTITIYGNFVFTSGTIANAGTLTFGATSGTKTITSNSNTIDQAVTINGVGGTFQLADAMTVGATRTFTLTNGTLNLNNQLLTVGLFSSSNSNTRTIAFGSTGSIKLNAAGGTLWTTATNTNFAYTGTSNITIDNNTATATTLTPGTLTETQALNFNIISGTYTLTLTNTPAFKNLNFVNTGTTGFAGTLPARTVDTIIYGNLTISSNIFSLAASTSGFIFRATSGIQILTSNTKTFDMPMAQNGAGGTLQLADAFAMGSTRTFNFNNGTFDGNGQTMTGATALSASAGGVTAFKGMNTSIVFNHTSSTMTLVGPNTTGKISTISGSIDLNGYTWTATGFGTNVGTKSLTFNGGTLLLTGPYAPTMDNFNPLNFTTIAGTGTGYIRMNAAAAKTFSGGGSTFNCILSNDGAGAITITGANTFLGITNGVSPTAFIFTAGTTQTMGSWTVNGTAGNLVTITSTAAGTAANLVKTGGGTVSSNYLSLKDSAATPSTLTWYAGANSTNVSGNSGWIFTNLPSTANGNFFFMF